MTKFKDGSGSPTCPALRNAGAVHPIAVMARLLADVPSIHSVTSVPKADRRAIRHQEGPK